MTKRREAETVKIQALPTAPRFRNWKMAVRDEIAGASGDPQEAFKWILKVEKPGISLEDLEDSENFSSLDAKLAAAISKIAQGDLSQRINLLKDRKAHDGKYVTGRQMLFMIFEHYRISAEDGALLDLEDLMCVRLHNDDLRSFLSDWENVLTAMKDVPNVSILETLFRKQLTRSLSLKD